MRARVLFAVTVVSVAWSCTGGDRPPSIVVGRASPLPTQTLEATVTPGATAEPGPPEVAVPELVPRGSGRAKATGSGPKPASAFRGATNVPEDLLFFLVAGSDARPGQDVARSRADSIHIAAVDPLTRRGTILGLPRDSYVEVQGHGKRKINAALALGGPDLLVDTVRRLTGFPVSFYALCGFEGMVTMTDELGGVDVYVSEPMDDQDSGARFERGWHHMDGRQVLAFTRNRRVRGGDFTRSRNQGSVILHALEKLRAETSDREGVRHWMRVLYRHAQLNMGFDDAFELGVLARSLLPADLVNVVAPGTPRDVEGQSVVELGEDAYALFRDIGADAVADGSTTRSAPSPAPTAEPTPSPTMSASPVPTPPGLPVPG